MNLMTTNLTASSISQVLLLTTIFSLGACKQLGDKDNDSNNKSIDNAARSSANELRLNHCQPNARSNPDEEFQIKINSEEKVTKAELIEAWVDSKKIITQDSHSKMSSDVANHLKGTLKAAPIWLLIPFFNRPDKPGKISLFEGTPKQCLENTKQKSETYQRMHEADQQPISCYRVDAQNGPGIYLGTGSFGKRQVNVIETIRHSLLRVLAFYFAAHVHPEVKKEALKKGQTTEHNDAVFETVLKIKKNLSVAVFEDIRNGAGTTTHLDNLKKQAGEGYMEMAILAETIDSYYCSDDTYKTFEACFPQAFQVFTGRKANAKLTCEAF